MEGCFCPEGTTSYAPGFDVCVDLCGRLPMRALCPPLLGAEPSACDTARAHRACLLSLLGCVGPDNVPREVGPPIGAGARPSHEPCVLGDRLGWDENLGPSEAD